MTAISIDKFQRSLEDGQEFAITEALKVYNMLHKNSAHAFTATEILKEINPKYLDKEMEKVKEEETKLKKTFGIEDPKNIEGPLKDLYKTALRVVPTTEDDVALQYMQIVLNGAELYNENEIRNIFITVKSDTRGLNFPSGGIKILPKKIHDTIYFAFKK